MHQRQVYHLLLLCTSRHQQFLVQNNRNLDEFCMAFLVIFMACLMNIWLIFHLTMSAYLLGCSLEESHRPNLKVIAFSINIAMYSVFRKGHAGSVSYTRLRFLEVQIFDYRGAPVIRYKLLPLKNT